MEQADDLETALFYISHIESPCVDRRTGFNNREYYVRKAEKVVERLESPLAKFLLGLKIRQYSSEN